MTLEQVKTLLCSPAEDARGMTRWWWYGCCVEEAEICRELDYMKEAGIGGVELQILYPVTPDDEEKGFYNNIMGTSAVFSIFCDSIKFDKQQMTFTYYGRQRIERRTNILMRKLVTAGELKRVPRTENNPHGLLITNWRTLLNQDLEQKQKTIY